MPTTRHLLLPLLLAALVPRASASQLVNVSDGGTRISEEDAFSYAAVVLFGGFDSVASMLGLCIRYLARNPDTRREIVANLEDEGFMRSAQLILDRIISLFSLGCCQYDMRCTSRHEAE